MASTDRRIVLILNGHLRSGNDTFAEFVIAELGWLGWSTCHLSSVALVKNVLTDLGIDHGRKSLAERDLMAEMQSSLLKYDWLPLHWLRNRITHRLAGRRRGQPSSTFGKLPPLPSSRN